MLAWERFVEAQEAELGRETVTKWLKTLKVVRFDSCNLYLEAKDPFQAIWFEEHIRQKLATLFNNNKKRIRVHLTIANAPLKVSARSASRSTAPSLNEPFSLTFDEPNSQATFEEFVATDGNQLTYRVFEQIIASFPNPYSPQQVIQSPFNPVYVYGASGSGKTHLLMAVALALRARGYRVIYSHAQTFTDHVVSAIRAGEMSFFRHAYRNIDALLIDDVHVFSRKGATQEEFFHTFNTLHVAGKQIILSANCMPSELQLIEPRLVSRFEWGIVLALESPNRAAAAQILANRSLRMNYSLHPKVMDFLLDSFTTSKSLLRAFEAVILRSHLSKEQSKIPSTHLTVAVVKQLLADLLKEEKQGELTALSIVKGVAEVFGIRQEDILGKAKTRDYVLPRQLSMYLCRQQLKLSYVKIGECFNKDHSTVMASVKLIQKGIDSDHPEITATLRTILKKIKP